MLLDHEALAAWSVDRLGSEPAQVLFETAHLSQVVGIRLADRREVVIKIRPWQDRLVACGQVQHVVHETGYPAPRLLVAPELLGEFGVSAEVLVTGGELLEPRRDSAERCAGALARLMHCVPPASAVGTLAPSPGWVGWDLHGARLWPAPDDREGDLNALDAHVWLDELAAPARRLLQSSGLPEVIGHCDWYSQNLRWVNRQLHVVHDWDSCVAQPEAAIVGQAAAIWPGTGLPGEVATIEQSEQFLHAYEVASGRAFTDVEVAVAWAAGLWTRAFDAKKAVLAGVDPGIALSRSEGVERSRLAGLQ